jgi:predicted aldo/keto reductase-like oxidoreductase
MSHSKTRLARTVDRRDFLKTGVAAVGTAAAGFGVVAAGESSTNPKPIAMRPFGKTGRELPILGYGGAALPKKWGNTLSLEDRVKLVRHAYDSGIRYFDTAISYTYSESQAIIGKALKDVRDNVFITTKVDFWDLSKPDGRITKVDKDEVARQVEKNLAELQSDYIDAILIHGTPGVEQMTVEQCMEVQSELVKARDKGLVRFVGFSAHSYFDKALALISSGGFDQCMLSYGYLPRGDRQVLSARMVALRNACVAKAHELGMGVAAMKVVGGGVLGAWSGYVVPGFDKKRLEQLPAAAIRYVLDDERIHILVIGMRLKEEIDANIKTLSGDVTYTLDDRALLAEFCAKAFDSDAIKGMRID